MQIIFALPKTFIVGNFITYYILFNPILAGILENQDTLGGCGGDRDVGQGQGQGCGGDNFVGKSSNKNVLQTKITWCVIKKK